VALPLRHVRAELEAAVIRVGHSWSDGRGGRSWVSVPLPFLVIWYLLASPVIAAWWVLLGLWWLACRVGDLIETMAAGR
jgi:hypothetical protein